MANSRMKIPFFRMFPSDRKTETLGAEVTGTSGTFQRIKMAVMGSRVTMTHEKLLSTKLAERSLKTSSETSTIAEATIKPDKTYFSLADWIIVRVWYSPDSSTPQAA